MSEINNQENSPELQADEVQNANKLLEALIDHKFTDDIPQSTPTESQ